MKIALVAALSALSMAPAAEAQDGFYYGIGLGLTRTSTVSPVVPGYEADATDYSLALTAGYRFPATGRLAYGIEGNLDFLSSKAMSGNGGDACTGISPSWCEVDAVLRLRGTLSTDLASGSSLTTSLGVALASGVSENGPGNNLDTTGRGLSLGIGWESAGAPVRGDLNYDAIRTDNQTLYERDLDLIGLRVSYMF